MFAYAGSYTTDKRHGRGAGLTVWAIESPSAEWSLVQTLGDLVNPSFLAFVFK